MKTRIVIYGGTDLPPELVVFLKSLVKNLLKYPEVVLLSGGYDHSTESPTLISVDKTVLETAKGCLTPDSFLQRFETWLPKESDRKKVVRFREGNVVEISGSAQARRFKLVQSADAIITISGHKYTRSIIELALAIDKPVMPVRFTGGDSKNIWKMYEDDIINRLAIPDELMGQLKRLPPPSLIEKTVENLASFIKKVAQKKCLILMPFHESHDNFYEFLETTIKEAGHIAHRIDKNDMAGNIRDLFKSNLETSRNIIVDITGLAPNVLYELGYVHAKDVKPLIVLRHSIDEPLADHDLPFYLQQEMRIIATDDKSGYQQIAERVNDFLNRNA
ncbi:MAG: hypothetical protein WCF67_24585 [Chitinophagaceae bacterium]